MDLRLILDGGAKPIAPPGKGTESPPPPDEFKKTLNAAKKEEKTPGEVAEKEPNAQLQKLDSKEDEKEDCDAKPNVAAVVNIPVALLAQQAVSIPVAIAAPVKVAPQSTVAGDFKNDSKLVDTISPTLQPKDLTVQLPPDLRSLKQNLPNSKVIGFTDASTKSDANRLVQGADGQTKIDLPKDLNIQSVQTAQTSEITAQPEIATMVAKAVSGEGNEPVKNTIDIKIETKGVLAGTQTGNVAVAAKQEGSLSQSFDRQDSKSDDSKDSDVDALGALNNAPKTAVSNEAPIAPAKSDVKLDAANRQKIVDTVSQKIDELSVRSVRNEVRVQMQPAEMGTVVVNVRKDLEGLTATLSATNEPLRQALHESRNDLAGALADRNVGQVRVEVRSASADTMNMGQQFNQANSNSQQNHQQQQLHKQAVANLASAQGDVDKQPETKPARPTRAASNTALDLEI